LILEEQSQMIQLTSAAKVLAQLGAKNAVKDQIRRQGLKASQYTLAEINSWASLYVAEAMEDAKKMILAGLLGKRAQKAALAYIASDA
jgi:hypothetical protein